MTSPSWGGKRHRPEEEVKKRTKFERENGCLVHCRFVDYVWMEKQSYFLV